MGDREGFGPNSVDDWLVRTTGATPRISWSRLAGGHSNLTFELRDAAGHAFVVRRPPRGVLHPKAHDMGREFRILEALWPTDVPVAEPLGYCDDPDIAEAHFYVMARVEGRALHDRQVAADWLDMAARRRAAESFIDALAALHRLDPADIGLADLARTDAYVARQLTTWYRSWTASIEPAGHDDPRIHELHERLVSAVPEQQAVCLVHGDFGPHNCLFSQTGDVTAVLDWEIATLGDPVADLAYAINAWAEPGDPAPLRFDPPTTLRGFPGRDELIARYAAATGFDVGRLMYYRTFNAFKSACIRHGVYARYRAGQKDASGIDIESIFDRMEFAIDMAVDLATRMD